MNASKSASKPTVNANIAGLLKELEQLGQRAKPVEYQRPEQQAVVVKGK
jgi:hypothetical protein